jgi:hypothetical protein
MKPAPRFKIPYPLVYLAAFVLALALRLALLGALPLADSEAQWAMQALEITRGGHPQIGVQAGYVVLTSFLFFVFGDTNFMARFLPALAGSLLVFVPLLFPERVKPRVGAVLAVILAIDPGMVAISRQAGSPILAIVFSLAAWKFWEARRPQMAGVMAGLALLGGPALWTGLLGIAIASLLHSELDRSGHPARDVMIGVEGPEEPDEAEETASITGTGRWWDWMRRDDVRLAAWAAGAAFLFAGSLFIVTPNGLSAAFGSIPAWLTGWWTPSEVPAGRLLLALFIYAWPALILAALTLVRRVREKNPLMTRMSWWLVVALVLALVYPARQVSDLAWVLLPLWILAAREISRRLEIPHKQYLELAATYGLMLIFAGYGWLSLADMAQQNPPSSLFNMPESWTTHLLIGIGALIVAALVPVIIGTSWSTRVGRQAAVAGFLTLSVIWLLAGSTGVSGLRNDRASELWLSDPRIAQAELLAQTVDSLSEWNTGDSHDLTVALDGTDWPSLRWALRRHPLTVVQGLDQDNYPSLIIGTPVHDFSASGNYAGQDFTWRQWTVWDAMSPLSWIDWIFDREIPRNGETIVLWVNTGQFPFQSGK